MLTDGRNVDACNVINDPNEDGNGATGVEMFFISSNDGRERDDGWAEDSALMEEKY